MEYLQIILIFASFAIGVACMVTKKVPTVVVLPTLGVVVAIFAGVPFITPEYTDGPTIVGTVISDGATRLAGTIVVTIFGAMLAKVMLHQGISESIIKKAAELAGDKPLVIAFIISFASALIFTSISGTGAVIMVGTIAIPLLLTAGIKKEVAASMFLLSYVLGQQYNVAGYQMYIDVIGMDLEVIRTICATIGVIVAIVLTIFILINVRNKSTRASFAMPVDSTDTKHVNFFAMLSPLVPIVLVFFFSFSIEAAILVACIYAVLTTTPTKIGAVLTYSIVEGIKDVSGAIALMIGIGILLNGVSNEYAIALMEPVFSKILPSSPIVYVIFFALLSPLALYRGPLNLFGLGSGVASIMVTAAVMPLNAVGAALAATSVVQGASDPTNTHNVVVCDMAKVDVTVVLKRTLPYTMTITFFALIIAAVVFF